jgi:hypothetical protein
MIIDDYKNATKEELANQILANSGDRPLETSFLRAAAIELAKRLLPNIEPYGIDAKVTGQGGGQASPRRLKSMKGIEERYNG